MAYFLKLGKKIKKNKKNAWGKIWYSKYDGGCMAMHIEKMLGLQRININSLEYESTWIEIKNNRSKNIDCEYL